VQPPQDVESADDRRQQVVEIVRDPARQLSQRFDLLRLVQLGDGDLVGAGALHHAFFEAGIEGLWTPILIPRIGYCEYSCVLCGQVCPTGAIQKITELQKTGKDEKTGKEQKPIAMGTAMYDHGRCLPWAMATPCIVCEEFCPTSPKAIWAEEAEVPRRESKYKAKGEALAMGTIKVQRPHVDPSLCIGCGACEKVCPIVDKPAVYVTNAGETRSKTNVILLENTSYGQS